MKTAINIRGNYLRLIGLVVDRNGAYSTFDSACTGSINVRVWSDHVDLIALEIRNSAMSGVYLKGADDGRVVRNWIHNNGTHANLDHGIYYSSGRRGLIANNLIEANYAAGIKLGPGRNDSHWISQNTVVRNGRTGLMVTERNTAIRIVNNIFALNQYGSRTYRLRGVDNTEIRNLIWGNKNGAHYDSGCCLTRSEEIAANPRFAGATDYDLLSGSPAVDRAIPSYSQRVDFRGRRRPRGAGPDLGAFER